MPKVAERTGQRPPVVEAAEFAWKPNSRIPVPPAVAAAALRQVYETHQAVKPEWVVQAATPPDAPLHPAFEWDDTAAAQAHREAQARHLMRSLVVVYRKPDQTLTPPVRAFVKVTPRADEVALTTDEEQATQPRAYWPTPRVMSEPALRQQYVRQAYRELRQWRQRYREIAEFAALFEHIDALEAQIAS